MKRFLAAVAVVAIAAVASGCGGAGREAPSSDALLIVSMPGVGWADVKRLDLPNLEAFAADSAIGHIATRLGRRSAAIDASYLTIGAGTRALAPPDGGGIALDPREQFAGNEAATLVERRTGESPIGPAYLNVASATERNAQSSFGATVGALGDALVEAGVRRSVIANADTALTPGDTATMGRDAVAALMDSKGFVEGGAVGGDLLERAPEAAWGLQLDSDVVLEEFREAWRGAGQKVVLVEASDLRRSSTYDAMASSAQGEAMRGAALRRTDALLGRLLDSAGPSAAVLLVSPIAPPGRNDLALVALRTPKGESGLLRSATTRRTGYVQLADVAPTILTSLGQEVAEDAEGRPFTVEADGRSLDQRVGFLVKAAEKSQFRDTNLPVVVISIVLLLLLLAVGAAVLWHLPQLSNHQRRRALRIGSYFVLAVVPATFAAQLPDEAGGSTPLYAAIVVAIAVAGTAVCIWIEDRVNGAGLICAVALVVATIALDVLVGAPLQVNSIFGYSVAVAGRFAGVGNLAFALLSSAALLLAVLLAHRFGDRGRVAAVVILVFVVLVDGLPMFGADVGGVLSMVPAFGIAALLMFGRRVRGVDVGALALAALVILFGAAFVDTARPPETRTHLARLAEHLTDGRWDRLFDSLVRRWAASFGSGDLGAYVLLLLVALVTAAYVGVVAVRSRERNAAWRRLVTMAPTLRAASVGLSLLAILGLVANDSSIAVPATMLIVAVPVAVERSLDRLPLVAR